MNVNDDPDWENKENDDVYEYGSIAFDTFEEAEEVMIWQTGLDHSGMIS